MLTARQVSEQIFGTALRGYDPDEVDEFLVRVVESLAGWESGKAGSVTSIDVAQVTFATRIRGYDLDEVDDFLDDGADTLNTYEQKAGHQGEPSRQAVAPRVTKARFPRKPTIPPARPRPSPEYTQMSAHDDEGYEAARGEHGESTPEGRNFEDVDFSPALASGQPEKTTRSAAQWERLRSTARSPGWLEWIRPERTRDSSRLVGGLPGRSMRLLPRPRTRTGRVGVWLGVWAISLVLLVILGAAISAVSINVVEQARPCWDFDPAEHDIDWPIERSRVETLDIAPSDRMEVLRWIDAGCAERTTDLAVAALVLIGLLGVLLAVGSLVVAPILATLVMRLSRTPS